MLDFMDFVQQAFATASSWDPDNSYGTLTATARALLDFRTPNGLALHLSSLSSPSSATSYTLANAGVVDGSISYLYSSLPLRIVPKSSDIPLRSIIQGYRRLHELRRPDEPWWSELWHRGRRIDRKGTLLYGRLYLPASHLEALYLCRLSPTSQLKLSCVSSSALKSGGSILFLLSQDRGKYSTEYLYSTDSALLGIRGLYNIGRDPRQDAPGQDAGNHGTANDSKTPSHKGRFSLGAEFYYGLLNKSGGVSTGIRFATLPQHTGFPYTMTLTLNPLMGNLSSTYAVRAGPQLALCSRFDFNFYSYESDFQVGLELWRRPRERDDDLRWALRRIAESEARGWPRAGPAAPEAEAEAVRKRDVQGESVAGAAPAEQFAPEDTAGVLKARLNQDGAIALLWEGRAKELLYSFGLQLDFKQREQIFRGVGLEMRYSS